MGSRTIVYFGVDDCLRIPVLEYAGYEVIGCATIPDLMKALEQSPRAEAVVFAEQAGSPSDAAASAARERTQAAFVLFEHPWSVSRAELFDCVVTPGTHPGDWLEQIARAIEAAAASAKARPAVAQRALQKRDGAERLWSEIARDLQGPREERPGCAPNGLRDFRYAGRIRPGRRGWA